MPDKPEPAYWIRRYEVPPKGQEGWGIIVVDSKGFLGIVSDYGDYAYHWSSFGKDFFGFLQDIDDDYLAKKITKGKMDYDPRETVLSVKRAIIEQRRGLNWDKDQAREEWDLIRENDDLSMREWFGKWYDQSKLDDASELFCTERPPQVMHFTKRIWPRFIELLKANPPTPLVISAPHD